MLCCPGNWKGEIMDFFKRFFGFKDGGVLKNRTPIFRPYAFVQREPVLSGGVKFWIVKECLSKGWCSPETYIPDGIYIVDYCQSKEMAIREAEKRTTELQKEDGEDDSR